jgi:hypothetical protein
MPRSTASSPATLCCPSFRQTICPRRSPRSPRASSAYHILSNQQPCPVLMVWPADRKLANRDSELLSLFLDTFAGDPDTNLYRLLVNGSTREADFGIKGINAYLDRDQGNPIYLMFRDMPPARMNDADLASLRAKVLDELKRVAAYPDGSTELESFNARLRSRVLERRRFGQVCQFAARFGFRGIGSEWVMHLYRLNREAGFRKSLTEKTGLDSIEQLLAGSTNIWRERLEATWNVGARIFERLAVSMDR